MTTFTAPPDQTGLILGGGDILNVNAGGAAVGTTIVTGGVENVNSGGAAIRHDDQVRRLPPKMSIKAARTPGRRSAAPWAGKTSMAARALPRRSTGAAAWMLSTKA